MNKEEREERRRIEKKYKNSRLFPIVKILGTIWGFGVIIFIVACVVGGPLYDGNSIQADAQVLANALVVPLIILLAVVIVLGLVTQEYHERKKRV